MFRRKKRYEWDVGVHYVGEMCPGSRYRTLLDFVTAGQVDWSAMPEHYDRFIYPDLSFDARTGAGRLRQDLIARFPHQRDAIDRYFEDVVSATRWFGRLMLSKLLPPQLYPLAHILKAPGSRLALATTRDYILHIVIESASLELSYILALILPKRHANGPVSQLDHCDIDLSIHFHIQ